MEYGIFFTALLILEENLKFDEILHMKPRELLEIKEESEKHSNFLSNLTQAKPETGKEDILNFSHKIDDNKVQDINAQETDISKNDSNIATLKPIDVESIVKEDVNPSIETNAPSTLIQDTIEIHDIESKSEVDNETFDQANTEMQIDEYEGRVESPTMGSFQEDDLKHEMKEEQSIEDLKFDSDNEIEGISEIPSEVEHQKDQIYSDDKDDLQEDDHEKEMEPSEINDLKVVNENENNDDFSFSDTEEIKPIADTSQDFFASFGGGNSNEEDNAMQTGSDDWGNFEETGKVEPPTGDIDDDFDDFDDFESATNLATVGANAIENTKQDSYHVLEDILRKVGSFNFKVTNPNLKKVRCLFLS